MEPFGLAEDERSYHSGKAGRVVGAEAEASAAVIVRGYASYFAGPGVVEDPALGDRVIITFATGRYRPPHRLSVRCSPNWMQDVDGTWADGEWTFEVGGDAFRDKFEFKLLLNHALLMEGNNWCVYGVGRRAYLTDDVVRFSHEIVFRTERFAPSHLVTLRTDADGWGRDLFGTYRDGAWWFAPDVVSHPAAFKAKFVLDRRWFMDGDDLQIEIGTKEHRYDEAHITFPTTEPEAFHHGIDGFVTVDASYERTTPVLAGSEGELYDVIVIGSGMGGGVLAEHLSDLRVRTLVLEAGGVVFPMHYSNVTGHWDGMAPRHQLGTFVNKPGSQFMAGPHFVLGGRSVYWSGIIPRMRSWEFDAWPDSIKRYLCDEGGYDEAEKLLSKATASPFESEVIAHLAATLGDDYSLGPIPRSLHAPAPGGSTVPGLGPEKARGVFSTADLLLDSTGFTGAVGSSYLAVNLHQLATRLVTEGPKVTGVECQDLLGRTKRTYRAKHVVLACGSLESPRLALNSELTDPTHRIGVGLTDHPAFFSNEQPELPPGPWGDRSRHAKVFVQRGTGATAEHPFNTEVLINPMYWDFRHADPEVAAERAKQRECSKLEVRCSFASPLDDGNRVWSPGLGKKLEVFVRPNEHARVHRAAVTELRSRIFAAFGLSTKSEDSWGYGNQGTVHHAGGTLRMSADRSGVVDEHHRFEAYDNLSTAATYRCSH